MIAKKLLTIGLACYALSMNAFADQSQEKTGSTPFTITQTKAINQAVHDYILANPSIIMEAALKYRNEERGKQTKQTVSVAITEHKRLFNDPTQPYIGNPNGSVTLVEFFDYQCIMCYKAYKNIEDITKQNPNLRVVFRYLPIFGEASIYASKVDLLAMHENKYAVFHHNMFKAKNVEGSLTIKQVKQIAKASGIEVKHLKQVSQKATFIVAQKNNSELAAHLRIMGTPAFFIAPTAGPVTLDTLRFYGGLVDKKQLQRDITTITQKTKTSTVK